MNFSVGDYVVYAGVEMSDILLVHSIKNGTVEYKVKATQNKNGDRRIYSKPQKIHRMSVSHAQGLIPLSVEYLDIELSKEILKYKELYELIQK